MVGSMAAPYSILEHVLEKAINLKFIEKGDRVVVTSGSHDGGVTDGFSHLLKVVQV
jgi:hypothetical protein